MRTAQDLLRLLEDLQKDGVDLEELEVSFTNDTCAYYDQGFDAQLKRVGPGRGDEVLEFDLWTS